MRENKYRAWLPSIKKMTYSYTLDELINWNTKLEDNETAIWLEYAGLHDKNDKEIYESDMLYCYGYKAVVKVGFHDAYNGWYAETEDGVICELNKTFEMAEVIGNIYENPELLSNQR